MKKIILMAIVMMITSSLFAQKLTKISIQSAPALSESTIELRIVADGATKLHSTTTSSKSGAIGFLFDQSEESFIVVTHKKREFIFYAKPGDEINASINCDNATYQLMGNNTEENKALCIWNNYVAELLLHTEYQKDNTYASTDFFRLFEEKENGKYAILKKMGTKNDKFNVLMKFQAETDIDYYGSRYRTSITKNHPVKSDYPKVFGQMKIADHLKSDLLLNLPNGVQKIQQMGSFYSWYNGLPSKDLIQSTIDLISNDVLKGEYVIVARKIKKHSEYEEHIAKFGKYLITKSQNERMDNLCAIVANNVPGQPATNFTYPDINGKMVSLSDFKGKVVYVDMWATWCGPCRRQIPHLVKLEKELENNKDIVFLSVSLDHLSNIDGWKKMIKENKLGGVQLITDGDRKICRDYKFTGIPHFMIIDKKGNVYSESAPFPSSSLLKNILRKLASE